MISDFTMSVMCNDGSVFVNVFYFYGYIRDSKVTITFSNKLACWQINTTKEDLLQSIQKYELKENINSVVDSIVEDKDD